MNIRHIKLFKNRHACKRHSFSSYVGKHNLTLVDNALSVEDEALIVPLLDALLTKKRYEGMIIMFIGI